MFVSAKRYEREKQELLAASRRLADAILKSTEHGIFLIDSQGRLQEPVSRALGALFRRATFTDSTFPELIVPLVGVKTLAATRSFLQSLVAAADPAAVLASNPLKDTDMRLPNPDGSFEAAHYAFDFHPVEGAEPRLWLVRVTDITLRMQSMREADELRSQLELKGQILRSVLHAGPTRFAAFLQRTDLAMRTINAVLKKPARAEDAFRAKLEETLEEVDRVRRDAVALKLAAIEAVAREFEDSLHELRNRTALSGSDFLPLAVKLDQLYSQFAALRAQSASAGPARAEDAGAPPRNTNGTQVIEAPKFVADRAAPRPVPGAQRSAPAGSLENTLRALCDHVAQEHDRNVLLECQGLQLVPSEYQSAIKNVAIQLIRNAVMHGVESAAERDAARKPLQGSLRLEFKHLEDGGFELLFEDDGRGLNPDQVRSVAVERGVITGETAARLRDREAIKLIFKSGFSTLPNVPGEPPHGTGLSLVRRYVHEAGGKIALASLQGHETRFKMSLPPLGESALADASDTTEASARSGHSVR